MSLAQRLKRAFNIDVSTGDTCVGAVKVIASIEGPVGGVHEWLNIPLERCCAAREAGGEAFDGFGQIRSTRFRWHVKVRFGHEQPMMF